MAATNHECSSIFPDFAYESDIEAELEVDQLDSDSDNDDVAYPTDPNTSKNGVGRPGERVPGHTLLSEDRIENMIRADGLCMLSPCQDDIPKLSSLGVLGNLALSKEGLFLLSVATVGTFYSQIAHDLHLSLSLSLSLSLL